ncbi:MULTISPECIES: DUF3085 domain-containing protein [Cupriavidus]|uniref:DUF3085 domain-containing protein n=1 Tax=Cupriavidus TaxID=106589 RepID=UPI0012456616|nr:MULTISPECIES: DUF3085 domain-containing protein [Cupriavidus]KAB0599723.1 DUF3085 domain-containing protein [Cupriavidus pauculus]KAI3591814.1 hypothetical protein D9X30_3224 [Cupriavidus sp. U2]MBY4733518.1 DUF3085 domain-containing protein [Cupriavidus pauculus]UAL03745.1 DUF3085 domain-containing protein [Cupriavidus pauculus]
MPQITLSRTQAASLVAFCDAAGSNEFFIAKDHGAYVGFSTGSTPEQQCLFYFKGCNPAKDADFYENARHSFGGDDFGERLPLDALRKALDNPRTEKIRIAVTSKSIRVATFA